MTFGQTVVEKAGELKKEGKDVNQIAGILCNQDSEGQNFGLGVLIFDDGKPRIEFEFLLRKLAKNASKKKIFGIYQSPAAYLDQVKSAILKWQRIPEKFVDNFALVIPSDAGTGAVSTGMQTLLCLNPNFNTIGVEPLGWPAYKTMATANRVGFVDFTKQSPEILSVFQLGPLNTTGKIIGNDEWKARAKKANECRIPILLDRAYSGFDFSQWVDNGYTYDDVMHMSIRPLLSLMEEGTEFALAISPTKAFVTFNSRPGGFLLLYSPDKERLKEMEKMANLMNRARGSSFDHPSTRALLSIFLNRFDLIERQHKNVLNRLRRATDIWQIYAMRTPLEKYFGNDYAGMFRNFPIKDGADVVLYEQHLYPVFSDGMCRINVTGITDDEEIAKKQILAFAEQVKE